MVRSSSAAKIEWSLLRATCSPEIGSAQLKAIRQLISSSLEWGVLLELAERHGVLPLLHQTLSTMPDCIPSAEMNALEQAYLANLHKALFLSRELIRILDSLQSRNIQVLPYKGLALAETIYKDIALRQAGDIDLLIRPDDLPRIRGAAQELGYVGHSCFSAAQERAFLKSGYELAFDGPAGPNLLEVQWAVQPRFYAVDFDQEGLFARAVTVSVAGREMSTPGLEDLFIVLSLHAAKHAWGRLIWICDLARIMAVQELNWEWIAAEASKLGIVRILRVAATLVHELLGVATPAGLEYQLPPDPGAAALSKEIESHMSSGTAYNPESLGYFRLMLGLREHRVDRIRFVTRLLLTPGPGEWSWVRLPEPLFPLYRLVRLSRLAARLVRA